MRKPKNVLLKNPGPHRVSPAYGPGESPLPMPDGWFCVGLSSEFKPGDVASRQLGDQDLVVYRTESGILQATRPYCPHMGAHLGQGGTVNGEDITCPLHRFRYGPDGTCTGTGPAYRRVPKLKLSLVPVREVHGFVMAWLHHDGAEPGWEIPTLDTTGFSLPVQHLIELPGHPQEVGENAFDFGHLTALHGKVFAGSCGDGKFSEGPASGSVGTLTMRLPLPWGVKLVPVPYQIQMHGLGHIVTTVNLPGGPVLRTIVLATPVGPWRIQLRSCLSAKMGAPRFLPDAVGQVYAKLVSTVAGRVALEMHKSYLVLPEMLGDGPTWAGKKYYHRPRLVDGDGPLMQYRKWAEQFYAPEALPRRPAMVPEVMSPAGGALGSRAGKEPR